MSNAVWTDAMIADLKRFWPMAVTAEYIGRMLGVSRNAVIGKAHRLGLSGTKTQHGRPR